MPDPAENAATVREAVRDYRVHSFGDGLAHRRADDALAALAALLAQAEAAERERNFWERSYKQEHRTRHAMEDTIAELRAERDRLITVTEARYERIGVLEAERDAAVRERDQAREALRWYAERRNYMPPAGTTRPNPTAWIFEHDSFDGNGPGARARAALTGEGNERTLSPDGNDEAELIHEAARHAAAADVEEQT